MAFAQVAAWSTVHKGCVAGHLRYVPYFNSMSSFAQKSDFTNFPSLLFIRLVMTQFRLWM